MERYREVCTSSECMVGAGVALPLSAGCLITGVALMALSRHMPLSAKLTRAANILVPLSIVPPVIWAGSMGLIYLSKHPRYIKIDRPTLPAEFVKWSKLTDKSEETEYDHSKIAWNLCKNQEATTCHFVEWKYVPPNRLITLDAGNGAFYMYDLFELYEWVEQKENWDGERPNYCTNRAFSKKEKIAIRSAFTKIGLPLTH